jgi:hypothetical protein
MNLDTLRIGQAVVHNVPRAGSGATPTLTDAAIPLDGELGTYFATKLRNTLTARGLEVVSAEDLSPCVRQGVHAVLSDPRRVVRESKKIASHLYDVQTQVNSPGLLVVMTVTTDDGNSIALMKTEAEAGLRFEVRKTRNGTTVDLELLRNLTLTQKTKVFKAALLGAQERKVNHVHGYVSDNQRGAGDGRGVADFFLGSFLGCTLKRNSAETTKSFVRAAEAFVNGDGLTDESRSRYMVAFLAELQSENMDLSPQSFVRANLAAEHRQIFNDSLREHGLDPRVAFQKDPAAVRFDNFRLKFACGMTLIGTRQDLNERVRMPPDASPDEGVLITDRVKELRGR